MVNKPEYNPAYCEHKLPNGLSAWSFQSEEQSNLGGANKVSIHVCVMCGDINICGYRPGKDGKNTNTFHKQFNICHPDAIDAIIKQANFFNEEIKWGRINAQQKNKGPQGAVWAVALIEYIRNNYKRRKDVWIDNHNIATLTDEGVLEMFMQQSPNTPTTDYQQLKEAYNEKANSERAVSKAYAQALIDRDALKEKAEKMEKIIRLCMEYSCDPDNDDDPVISLWNIQNICKEQLPTEARNDYPKLTPEQIAERKEAIEWYRNPAGSAARETIEDILFKTGKHNQEECSELADMILKDNQPKGKEGEL